MYRSVVKDSSLYFLSRLVVGGIGFVFVPFAIDVFGIEAYGRYSLIVNSGISISSAIFGWIYQSHIRFASEGERNAIAWLVTLFNAALLSGVALLTWAFGQSEAVYFSVIIGASLGLYNLSRADLQAHRLILKFSIAEILRAVLISIFPVLLAQYLGEGSVGVMAAWFALGNLFYFALAGFYSSPSPKLSWPEFSNIKSDIFRFISYGAPVALWLTFSSLMMSLDRYLMLNIAGAQVAGNYAAQYDLILKVGASVVIPISTAIIPIFSRAGNGPTFLATWRYFSIVSAFSVLSAGFLFLCLVNFADKLNVNAGIPFDGKWELFFFVFGCILWQSSMFAHKYLEVVKRTNVMLCFLLFSLAFHYVILCTGKYFFGVLSFAVAPFASGFLYFLLCVSYARNSLVKNSHHSA